MWEFRDNEDSKPLATHRPTAISLITIPPSTSQSTACSWRLTDVYLNALTTASLDDENLFQWWANSGLPQLMSMAFDILLIPAMSAETERIFSGTKLTISPQRNRLEEDIIEATECLNRWYKAGI
jgi:hAT family C-terminal dimerisation region